jgi:2-C-methyl-D-erythritol 4-phosphate cytidylyltransferase
VLDAAEVSGAAAPVVPVSSTLLAEGPAGWSSGPLARMNVREVQTPQAARRDMLESALASYPCETDETSALFRCGFAVALVEGARSNIKITESVDLRIAEALLAQLQCR